MSEKVKDVCGIVPILATPFLGDGALDLPSLARLTEFQLQAGTDGVATFGMASEAFALTAEERVLVLKTITDVIPKDMPLVAGISATSDFTASQQAREAVHGGATALMVLPPSMVKPSAAQLVDFYSAVAEASGVPIMIQDAPGVTGVAMSTVILNELSCIPGVDLVKIEAPPTAPKVTATLEATEGRLKALGGHNALFLIEEYDRGVVGTMPACEFTDELRTVVDFMAAGHTAEARAAFIRILPLIRFGMQGPIAWAVHKHVLARRGIIANDLVRSPAAELDASSRKHLDWILDDLQLSQYRP